MLRSLKEVQADDSVVGFYQSNTLGAFYKQSLIDLQATHQERLRHGGVVVVHGMSHHDTCNVSCLVLTGFLQTLPKRPEVARPSVPSDSQRTSWLPTRATGSTRKGQNTVLSHFH